MRQIDTKRLTQTESRLRRQLSLTAEEADEARSVLEEVRTRSERDVKKAREARRDALRRLAAAEARVVELESNVDDDSDETRLLRADNERLRNALAAVEEEAGGLRVELEAKIEEAAASMDGIVPKKEEKGTNTTTTTTSGGGGAARSASTGSTAQPSDLRSTTSELNRTRIKLADAERSKRQLNRKLKSVQDVADTAVRHKEEARSTRVRLERVEAELTELRKEREESRAVEGRWADFREDILGTLGVNDDESYDGSSDDEVDVVMAAATTTSRNTPPEVSAIVRRVRSLQDRLQRSERDLTKARADLETTKKIASAAERRSDDAAASELAMKRRLTNAETKADRIDLELRKLQAQEDVWKRENGSLRSLLETYERAETHPPNTHSPKKAPGAGAAAAVSGDEDGPTVRGLRTSLSSAQERIKLLTEEGSTLKTEANAAKKESEDAKTELARVKDKFGKLRDALFKERETAERAEERAAKAEVLAGKGSFDPESTRVLHLKQNPLMDAVRAKYESEIDALRKALEEKNESSAGSTSLSSAAKTPLPGKTPHPPQSGLDAQKLHRRLKESFREQIGKFREGVYLLTGFKIDMIADTAPIRFKVRSVFAEREEDHLVFAWPKMPKGEEHNVTMLDLLDTPQAQLLTQDPSFEYMTKYKSLPAFMANVQLDLFAKQTLIGGG